MGISFKQENSQWFVLLDGEQVLTDWDVLR